LQDKLKEDFHWKKIIDEFHDGIVFINEADNKMKYKNKPVAKIFCQEEVQELGQQQS